MTPRFLLPTLCLTLSLGNGWSTATETTATSGDPARDLANRVYRASGGDRLDEINRLRFTFHLEKEGQTVLEASHDWDLRTGKDTVTWDGKTVTVSVTNPGDTDEEQAAYHRWVNDSYWLLAPQKVLDPGVNLEYRGQEELEGERFEVLHLSFEKVGLTPDDQYLFYIDPDSALLRFWKYTNAQGESHLAQWEEYTEYNGLNLALFRQMEGKRIRFGSIEVE